VEQIIKKYLNYLSTHSHGEEMQHRTDFHNFFENVTDAENIKVEIIQEDKHSIVKTIGTPDFFVYTRTEPKKFIGFIECKTPSANLDKVKETEQIKNYQLTTDNIILTNYKRFILLHKDETQHDITLSGDATSINKFRNMLVAFYSYNYLHIKNKKTLVSELANQSFYYSTAIKEFVEAKENANENFYTKFNALYGEYKKSINYNYVLVDFCDIYAQSLVYGLMLARLDANNDLDEEKLNYLQDIPDEYKLLKEFLSQAYISYDLPKPLRHTLINIGKNINMIDVEAIQKEFAKTSEGKQHIAIFLYEDFLQEYDKLKKTQNRREGGVYYTPEQATNFITHGVNELIKTRFNMPRGYLAEKVNVLDFACGTGTFLHSVFEEMLKENKDDLDRETIKNKIVKDIYGIELLFVPYIISYTMLTRFLKEHNIILEGKERLGIYLSNTIDIKDPNKSHDTTITDHMPNLKNEYQRAMDIKSKDEILAIIGNPPYFNGISKANKGFIDDLLKEYKKGLNEKK
jgi:transcriptional regulator CtsR